MPGSSRPFGPISLRLAAAAALLVALLIPAGSIDHGPVWCPFRLLTGLPCPACGLTRSWVAFVHGRIGDSIAFNPFGPLTVIVAVLLVVGVHKRFPGVTRRLQSRPVVGALVGVWLAVWLVRLEIARQ